MNSPDILTEAPTGAENHLNGKYTNGVVGKPADLGYSINRGPTKEEVGNWLYSRGSIPVSGLSTFKDLYAGLTRIKTVIGEIGEIEDLGDKAIQIPPVAKAVVRDYAKEWRQLDQAMIERHGSKTNPVVDVAILSSGDSHARPTGSANNYVERLEDYLKHPVSEGPASGIYERILKELAAEKAPAHVRSSIVGNPPGEQEPKLPSEGQSEYPVNITDPVLSDSSVDPEYGESPARELYNKKVKEIDQVKQDAATAIEGIRWLCATIGEISELFSIRIGIIVRQPDVMDVLADLRRRLEQNKAKLVSGKPVTMKTPLIIIRIDAAYNIENNLLELLGLLKKRIITRDYYDDIFEWTKAEEVKRVLGEIKNPEDY